MANNPTNNIPSDGEAVVTVVPNYSAAYLTIYPAHNGGKDMTFDDVMLALAMKGVKHNIKTDLIKSALETKNFDKELKIAEADMPVHGKNGTITYMFSKDTVLAPKEDDNGFVDYKDLGLIRNIREKELIAEITLPDSGTDGTDVRGFIMKAVPGKNASYTVGAGTKLTDDGLQIVAAIDGHVCFKNGSFCVESTVTIGGDVDASVGNLDFIGDIVIKGEVMEGFSVTSAKNITIAGNVTGAVVNAGGAITVKKGCINSYMTAHGDINCQFCEYSKIVTDGNLNAQTFVICDVYCAGDLTGKALNGGKYTVLGDAAVKYLGTKNYAPTEVIAGDNAVLMKEKEEALKILADLDVKIDRCTQVVDFLNEKRKQLKRLPEDKEELLGVSVKNKIAFQMQKKKLHKRIASIDDSLAQKQYRTVTVSGMAYPGVKVTINDASMKIETETPKVKIYLDDNGNIVTGIA